MTEEKQLARRWYRRRITESIKSFIIFLLLVLMLILLILLMTGQNSGSFAALLPEDRMVVYATGADGVYTAGMDTQYVLPATIAYRVPGVSSDSAMQLLYASGQTEKPYAALYAPIRLLFGAGSVCTVSDTAEGNALWARCARAELFVYLSFGGALPPAVIRAYTFSEGDAEEYAGVSLDEVPSGDTAYAKEIFLLTTEILGDSAEDASLCAVTRDAQGTVAVFRRGTGSVPAEETAPTVVGAETEPTEDGIAPLAEPNDSSEDAASVLRSCIATLSSQAGETQHASFAVDTADPSAILHDGIYRLPSLHIGVWDPEVCLFDDGETASRVLSLLGMDVNDTDNYYNAAQGGRVYLNENGRLWLSSDGTVSYTALKNGGIPITEYLGYTSVGGSYLLSEYLRAADRLLGHLKTLDASFGGGDLSVFLYEVRSADDPAGGVLLRYCYSFSGIPILDINGAPLTAMTLTAVGGVVKELTICVKDGTVGDNAEYLLPQSVVFAAIRAEQASDTAVAEVNLSCASLSVCYVPLVDGEFRAEWICVGRAMRGGSPA